MSSSEPAELGCPILYESEACIVLCKPAGILTQAPRGIDSLEIRLRRYLISKAPSEQSEAPRETYLGTPHRLDRPATGAIVFGKTRRATRRLVRQFERREIQKSYWACVEGQVSPASGLWYDLMRKVPGEPRAELASPDQPDAQLAILRYKVLGYFPWGTWLEIELETGRTHQIRLQAASRGHPVLGDFQYGSKTPFGPEESDWRLKPIALHSRCLQFIEPETKRPISIVAPVPKTWLSLGIDENLQRRQG